MRRVLFVFLDGVGIGPDDPERNPFFLARIPTLRSLLADKIPHLEEREVSHGPSVALPLDPLLGVKGLPQSGTGHTALLTGENGPELYGRHFGPWVPVRLRPVVERKNVLSRAQARGFTCAFANAVPKEYYESPWARRPAGPALAAEAAGLLTRGPEELGEGKAVSSEIVNTAWRTHLGYTGLPDISPREAGKNLARITEGADLTFFAHYGTDHAGHRGRMPGSIRAMERFDCFIYVFLVVFK
jgi:hypothetical protein